MTIKRDDAGVPILVEIRCNGKQGRCGALVASVKDYFDHYVFVEHRVRDRKTPLDLHGGFGFPGCPRHGRVIGPDHRWLEQSVDVDLEHAVEVAIAEGHTIRVPASANGPFDHVDNT